MSGIPYGVKISIWKYPTASNVAITAQLVKEIILVEQTDISLTSGTPNSFLTMSANIQNLIRHVTIIDDSASTGYWDYILDWSYSNFSGPYSSGTMLLSAEVVDETFYVKEVIY
jgi:hypothetical protein